MSVPTFPVDAYGTPRCPNCEGYVITMAHPDEKEGFYCRNCGADWFHELPEIGKKSNKSPRLPISGTDTYTTSDHLDKEVPPV